MNYTEDIPPASIAHMHMHLNTRMHARTHANTHTHTHTHTHLNTHTQTTSPELRISATAQPYSEGLPPRHSAFQTKVP